MALDIPRTSALKRCMKRLMGVTFPESTVALLSARSRAHSHKVVKEWGCHRVTSSLIGKFGDAVQAGPFKGLRLSSMTRQEHLGPFLLGLYESELDDAWEIVLQEAYSQLIDVGAKFGYYAVGLARRFPTSRVIAFDTDWWARKALREMRSANNVSNVEIRGYCGPDWLRSHLCTGAFILSDCEGFERELFCTTPIPELATATLIIETHEAFNPGVEHDLKTALRNTHVIREITSGSNRRDTHLDLSFLNKHERMLATCEVRSKGTWLFCLPRVGRNRLHRNECRNR